MKGRHRWGNLEFGVFSEDGVGLLDFGEDGFFGFVGDREASKVGEGG